MAPKTEADHVQLLLAILEHTDGKTDWDEIAKVTGLYKSGKFVRQAFNTMKAKYSDNPTPSEKSDTKKQSNDAITKGTPKKRGKSDETLEDTPTKKAKVSQKGKAIKGDLSEGVEDEPEEI